MGGGPLLGVLCPTTVYLPSLLVVQGPGMQRPGGTCTLATHADGGQAGGAPCHLRVGGGRGSVRGSFSGA